MNVWQARSFTPERVQAFENLGFSKAFSRLLAVREINPAEVDSFLHPSLKQIKEQPFWPNLPRAAAEIITTIEADETLAIFGDYDCDGVSATAILYSILKKIPGARVFPFIPRRKDEGYGISDAAIARLKAECPEVALIVTLDNGISAVDHVDQLRGEGIKVIVTDHHLPGARVPNCLVVNPKCEDPSSDCYRQFEPLCGAAIAFFLVQEIVQLAQKKGLLPSHQKFGAEPLILAGLATVTDACPLLGVNRLLVQLSLQNFQKWASMGLKQLYLDTSSQAKDDLTVVDYGFKLGPNINSVGRMGDAGLAFDLMVETDRERARELVRQMKIANAERKTQETKMTQAAQEKIVPNAPAQVIVLDEGCGGVSGIVASRILSSLKPPCPVCVVIDGRGSARAPAGYHLKEAFDAASSSLENYGGHALAGGFTVKEGQIAAFTTQFYAACQAQAKKLPPQFLLYDSELELVDLTLDLVDNLKDLSPFGEGNPEPIFLLSHLTLKTYSYRDGSYPRIQFYLGDEHPIRGLLWHPSETERKELSLLQGRPCDWLVNLRRSSYGGEQVELNILAFRPSERIASHA